MKTKPVCVLSLALILVATAIAHAQDAGAACGEDADARCPPDMTTVGFVPSIFESNWGCHTAVGGPVPGPAALAIIGSLCWVLCRRHRRGPVAKVLVLGSLLFAGTARALTRSADPDLDLALTPEPPPPRTWIAVTVNPLIFMIDRYGANLEFVPAPHHGIILTAFYVSAQGTERTNFPVFIGEGGEIGYRYYFGQGGPQGLFLSPSFLLGKYQGRPGAGDRITTYNLGGAVDLGYQAILWRHLIVGLGIGCQYTWASYPLPQQDLPVSIYANSGFRPRLLTSLGAAF